MAGVNWDAAYKDHLAGMKQKDIAEKYGVTVGAVKSRAARYWKKSGAKNLGRKIKRLQKRLQPKATKLQEKVAKKLQPWAVKNLKKPIFL